MNKRIITICAFCLIAIMFMVRSGLTQEPIFLPLVIDDASTTTESTATPAATATATNSTATGVDTTLFLDGALVEEPTIVDCTLTDGTTTQCYEITVVGTPANHDVGPFCPTSITDNEDAGGLWLDGENSYVIDGVFFTELAEVYGDELWNNIYNEDGSVNVIDNAEDFQVAARPNITEEYYYHCVDGNVEWLDGGVQPTSTIQVPIMPMLTDAPTIQFAEGAHSTLGVTFNGAALSGSADMAAILSSYTIAAFDDCGGHINPALGYHVHGTAGCSDIGEAPDGETAPFAIAVDGHTVHAPYGDNDDVELDECNGHTSEEYGYHYHANSLEENATLTCLTGLTAEGQGGGPGDGGPGDGGPGDGGPGDGGPPGGDPVDDATATATPIATTVVTTTITPTATATDTNSTTTGVDTTLFFDGALAEEATIVNCTLSDGTETTCYEITIAGSPANHDVGPFCPETTSTSADDAGIWFDGNGIYDLAGSFILGLADLYNDSNWKLYNDDGSVNITETAEEFDLAARPDVDPSLQNHCVEGRMEWLDNGEPVQTTVTIPINPAPADATTSGGNWGVTLNGVIIAASAPVQNILSAYTIAAFDDCGGHINPVDGYHLHGARGCSEVGEAAEGETPIFAYAMDGYPIHSALSDEDVTTANLDECNGHTTDELGYHYHANPAEENSVLTCFKGLMVGGDGDGDGGGDGGPPGGGPPGGGPPVDATATATPAATTTATPTPTPTPTPLEDPTTIGSNYLGSYEIDDTGFGTQVNVVVDDQANTRTITSNALPNHETGEFPNPGNPNTISAQDKSWTYTTEPTFVGTATFAREPGVGINGVKFEPDTAERVNCESGEEYNIEAIQDVTDLGLDFNNAHVQPTGEYHYHGVSELLVELYSTDQDLVHVAFAADGYLIYYSKSGAYQPSYRLGADAREGTNCTYTPGGPNGGTTITFGSEKDGSLKSDWDYNASYGQLDECSGITVDGQYIYLITNDYPYIPRCLMGEAAGGGPGGEGPGGGGPPPGQTAQR